MKKNMDQGGFLVLFFILTFFKVRRDLGKDLITFLVQGPGNVALTLGAVQ